MRRFAPADAASGGFSRIKKALLLCAAAIVLLAAAYLWYSRPLRPADLTSGSEVSAVGISCDVVTFTSTVTSDCGSIFTRDTEQIQAAINLLEDFPVNRRIDWMGLLTGGASNHPVEGDSVTNVRISLHYKTDDTWKCIDYDISSQGRMSLLDSDGNTISCTVSKDRTASLFQTLRQFYNQNREHPLWKDH
ncbi:hypothetical protein [Anaeromassilibacillus senegalensis]|uniref:hypothetical protein n=1 Tax=Anaeromassilibacillus senegalensis TaxID=1673717 RepID=UPI000680CB6F|nr:hypothetical protein [Anaeromassilibacillus senegalensis]